MSLRVMLSCDSVESEEYREQHCAADQSGADDANKRDQDVLGKGLKNERRSVQWSNPGPDEPLRCAPNERAESGQGSHLVADGDDEL